MHINSFYADTNILYNGETLTQNHIDVIKCLFANKLDEKGKLCRKNPIEFKILIGYIIFNFVLKFCFISSKIFHTNKYKKA